MNRIRTALAALIVPLALLSTGCSNDAAPSDDVMTPIPVEEATLEPEYSGADLAYDVERAIKQQTVVSNLRAVCEDVPVVQAGAIADCDLWTNLNPPNDKFTVRVTFEDAAGHFRWEAY